MSKTVMQNKFATIERAEIPRSSFDLSCGYKTTFDAGYLVPFLAMEALPGDTISLRTTAFARLATPIKPIMDNMFMETFFFSIPVRQVWSNFEKFMGEQEDPTSSTDFLIPTLSGTNPVAEQSISDYFGIPIGTIPNDVKISALFHRAYNHCYNNWFRDQNLIDSTIVSKSDGPDSLGGNYSLLRRRKRKDYFTSCLPWPQKGTPVTIPLAGDAPIYTPQAGGDDFVSVDDLTGVAHILENPSGTLVKTAVGTASAGQELLADLTAVTGIPINDLRTVIAIQRLMERDARGGTRYPEILLSHFGVNDPQMLVLQRPEFLGGGSSPININPVQQNTETPGSGTPQGNLAGFGTVTLRGHGFTKSFTEHCLIIGMVNVRADLTYQQGLERMWSRQTKLDFYWPALSHLGEQAVLNKEIFVQGAAADDDVFGYIPVYDEYRFKQSLITGLFRSAAVASLDVWHLSQELGGLPVLGETFIEDNPPIDRVVAVPAEPHFLFDAYMDIRAARVMPTYGTPGMMDHF